MRAAWAMRARSWRPTSTATPAAARLRGCATHALTVSGIRGVDVRAVAKKQGCDRWPLSPSPMTATSVRGGTVTCSLSVLSASVANRIPRIQNRTTT